MAFVPFVTRLKRAQKFLLPPNPEFIGYMLYTSSSFSTVFIKFHKMTRWWQNYLGLHGENVTLAYRLFALHIFQRLEFTIASVSARNVLSDSSFRDLPCVCNKDISIVLADLICLSQTPPIWLNAGGFLCQIM